MIICQKIFPNKNIKIFLIKSVGVIKIASGDIISKNKLYFYFMLKYVWKSGVNNKIAITNQDTIVITSEFYSTEIENFPTHKNN